MHCGSSKSPSHSVQVAALILKIPLFSVIELVGHTGLQSPQDVHSICTIFRAMMRLLPKRLFSAVEPFGAQADG